MLRQVIYVSSATQKFGPEALEDLLVRARANNQRNDITGMLLYHDLSFLQVIEGKRDDVDRLLARIRRDPSHRSMRVLHDERIADRDFKSWAMACRPASSDEARIMANPPMKLERSFISGLVLQPSPTVVQADVAPAVRAVG